MTTEGAVTMCGAAIADANLRSLVDMLVTRGFEREAAEDLCATHPPSLGEDVEAWLAAVGRNEGDIRRRILDEHHREGIPPFEPPPLSPVD